ncbi:hypothetical protein ABZ341_38105 [Streptomyces sp. NPDC006173]|uniref:hypothetical protein n=1 Tax=Streptomyces sp. NPDC006173 TaxID=3155349 RepID=UPI00340FE149
MAKNKVLAIMGALGTAVALIGFAAAPASAGATAYNTKTQSISYSPKSSMPTSCVTRPGGIYLTEDQYYWTQTFSTFDHIMSVREIHLATGWYDWTDCLYPHSDFTYTEESALFPRSGGKAAFQTNTVGMCGCGTAQVTWGSNLRSVL